MTILGIDIGGTQLKSGRVDENGRMLSSRSVKTPNDLGALETALHYIVASGEQPAGIGIACKGVIDCDTTQVKTLPGALHYLEGHRLSDLVRPALQDEIPICADNDARVALVGEMVWGAARGSSNAIMLTLGTGVGGAVLAGGQLLSGHGGVAGHLGHITVDPDGAPCICGNRGCLETAFSARSIEAEAFGAVRRGCASLLTDWYAAKPHEITCLAVFEAASGGDELARFIVERAVRTLGAAIAGLLLVFDPEIVILGGQVAGAGAALFTPLRHEVRWRTRVMLGREVPIVPQQVAENSGIAGAAALVLRRLAQGRAGGGGAN